MRIYGFVFKSHGVWAVLGKEPGQFVPRIIRFKSRRGALRFYSKYAGKP